MPPAHLITDCLSPPPRLGPFALQVKLVLAAAMWSNPHMLIMDEPTNYLDREALGALSLSINEWSGEKGRGKGEGGRGEAGEGGEGQVPPTAWTGRHWGHCHCVSFPQLSPTRLSASFLSGGVVVISHHASFTTPLGVPTLSHFNAPAVHSPRRCRGH